MQMISLHALFSIKKSMSNPVHKFSDFQQLQYICVLTITKNMVKLSFIVMFLNNLGLLK